MREEFNEYLRAIYVSEVVSERISQIIDRVNLIIQEEVRRIFVINYFNQAQEVVNGPIWFISERFLVYFPDITNLQSFIVFKSLGMIVSANIDIKNFDFENANSNSELRIRLTKTDGEFHEFKAIRKNCEYLWQIYQDLLSRYYIDLNT